MNEAASRRAGSSVIIEPLEGRTLFSAVVGPPAPAHVMRAADASALSTTLANAWPFIRTQLSATIKKISAGLFPSYTKSDGSWQFVKATDWTSGFFAGELWQAYAHHPTGTYRKEAQYLTAELASQVSAKGDLASRFMPTDYLQNQFFPSKAAQNALIAAAASKVSTFNSTVGMFETAGGRPSTSGNPKANFPVLMDQTMDDELILRAAALAHKSDWIKKVTQHLTKEQTTMIRPDGSTVQWAYFDSKTGNFIDGETRQGYSNSSTWSRGQAWCIYSYTTAAKLRGRADFLATAQKAADYFINHLPSDGIPYWDFNAPVTSKTPRDTSAAAIAASALLDLSKLVKDPTAAAKYESAAEQILTSLSSSKYLAHGSKSSGILLHGARWVPRGNTDESLVFGDYYYLEAINRFEAMNPA